MAVTLSLTNLANLQNENTAVAAINANNAATIAAFQDVLALDGTAPNSMNAALDMNSNRILNLPQAVSDTEPVRLLEVGNAPAYAATASAAATTATAQAVIATTGATTATAQAAVATTQATNAAASAVLAQSAAGINVSGMTNHGVMTATSTNSGTSTAAMTNGQLLVGQTGADPLPKTISGAITVAASGAVSIAASPALTGTPTAPTAAVDTNTTQIATTAMVLAQAGSATPVGDAITAVVGTSTRFARADHVHPFSATPCFFAHKNGTDQTGIVSVTTTQVTFGTELYDVGNYFASNSWTPPAGKINIGAQFQVTGTFGTGAGSQLVLFKNGTTFRYKDTYSSTANVNTLNFITDDICTGSDVYAIYVYQPTSSGTATITGATLLTWFYGHWICP